MKNAIKTIVIGLFGFTILAALVSCGIGAFVTMFSTFKK